VGDVVAAVAAVDEATALRALELIDVAYEPLPAVPDFKALGEPFVPGESGIDSDMREGLDLVAAELGYHARERVINTDITPFDQGTNASSGVAVMGQAVQRAAADVKAKVLEFAASQLDCKPADLTLEGWAVSHGEQITSLTGLIHGSFGGTGFEFTGEGFYKTATSHAAPLEAQCVFWENGWAGAEVEVDPDTGKITVLQLVASGDVGQAINTLTCRGQDEGAALMGYAQALFEEMRFSDGVLLNGEALDYRVPLAEDLPGRFASITQEQGHGPGPFGAKGAGEGAMVPVAAAIANAVHDAIGVRITQLPLTPERVFTALHGFEE
jgi:CO/xanthine dehydrogenase Mo-binding subunit